MAHTPVNEHQIDHPSLPISEHGLGGIRLAMSRSELIAILGDPTKSIVRLQQRTELLDYQGLRIVLNYDTSQVIGRFALDGYVGTTRRGLRVGMAWKEALTLTPSIHYNEDLSGWFVEEEVGIELEIGRPLHRGESSDDGWADEVYEVTGPDKAFIAVIAVRV